MILIAALNGNRTLDDHPAVPITPAQLAADGRRAVQAGLDALHIHPRDNLGRESLAGVDIDAAVDAIRKAVPEAQIGVTTGAWIVPDPVERLNHIEKWTALPDFASVNFDEPGAEVVADLLLQRGIAVEAGINSVEAGGRFLAYPRAHESLRIMIEPHERNPDEAASNALNIIATLDSAALPHPRLLHGMNEATWPLLRMAIKLQYNSRIGFEDTLKLPEPKLVWSNQDLIEAALAMIENEG